MKTQEILSIIALSLLGLCVLSGLVKMAMKKESHKKPYEQGCTASVFIAVVLLGNTHDIVLQFSKGMCKPCAEAAARAIDWQKELKL